MSLHIIQTRLNGYQTQTVQETEHALKEITQEVILSALAQNSFFKQAAFHGGTCLRIVHGLNRFSENLDFCLFMPNPAFQLSTFADAIAVYLRAYGYTFDIQDRSRADSAVQKLFMKESAIGLLLHFQHGASAIPHRPIKIKLEIDTNPPHGSQYSTEFVDFPLPFSIVCHDKPSLFAGKSHALLCSAYTKGRDWYDFLWYVGQKVSPNLVFLTQALIQSGFLSADAPIVDVKWLIKVLQERVSAIDWDSAKMDVARFIKPQEQHILSLWSESYFSNYVSRLEAILGS